METTARTPLHPLLTAAAISVTVFSAVGVGAITGLIPTSRSSSQQAAPSVAATPASSQVAAQAAAAQSPPGTAPESAPVMPAAPAATPAPQPVKKTIARAHSARPAERVVYRDFDEAPRVARAPAAQPPAAVEAPRPIVPAGSFGVVESVREITQPGETIGLGPIAGGIAGAVLGNQFGNGNGRSVMTVLGAAGGAFAGKEIEKQARGTKRWEIAVRLDDGSYRTVSSNVQPYWHAGDRVRMVEGKLQPV